MNKCLSNIINEENDDIINIKRMDELLEEAKEILKSNNMTILKEEDILKDANLLKKATENIIDRKNIEKKTNSIEAQQLRDIVKEFKDGNETTKNAYKTASAMLVHRMGNERNKITSIELEAIALRKIYSSFFADFFEEYNAGLTNFKRSKEETSLKFIEEYYNSGSTGDAKLTKIVNKFKEGYDLLRAEYHSNGIALGKVENYLPQTHDSYKYNKYKVEEYIEDGLKFFDFKKTKGKNGKSLTTPKEKEDFLRYVHENIRTNGLHSKLQNDIEISDTAVLSNVDGGNNISSIAGRKSLERKIFFKDAKSNHQFNIKYGESNIFDTINLNIFESADEIALVRKLSLNPEKGYRLLRELAEREGTSKSDLAILDKQEALVNKDKSITSDPLVAEAGKLTRYLATADKVGIYALSQISDIASSIVAKNVIYNRNFIEGLIDYVKVPMDIIKSLKKINDKKTIIRMTGITETLSSRNGVEARLNDVDNTEANFVYAGSKRKNKLNNALKKSNEILGLHSNAMIKISGMKDLTESMKFLAVSELYSKLTEIRFKEYKTIDKSLLNFMEVAGFKEKDFNLLKKIDTEDYDGAEIITSSSIARSENLSKKERMDLAIKFGSFAEAVSRYSVAEKGFHLSSIIDPKDKGTYGGQLLKSMTQLKSFPLLFIYNQIMGDIRAGDDMFSKSAILSKRIGVMMTFGYLTFQLKEVAAGREPMETNEKNINEIVTRSFMLGGGFGIFGDILFNDMDKYGKDGLDYLFGPVGSIMKEVLTKPNHLMSSTVEGFKEMYNEDILGEYSKNRKMQQIKEDRENSNLIETLDNFTSFTDTWYTKEVKQRLFFDELRRRYTKSYEKDMEKEEKILKQKNQQKLWFD